MEDLSRLHQLHVFPRMIRDNVAVRIIAQQCNIDVNRLVLREVTSIQDSLKKVRVYKVVRVFPKIEPPSEPHSTRHVWR